MDKNNLTLKEMIGNEYTYRGNKYKFLSYQNGGEATIIQTDQGPLHYATKSKLTWFLEDCRPIETHQVVVSISDKSLVKPDMQSENPLALMKAMLLQNMKDVLQDPSKVHQSKALVNATNAMCNLVSLELKIKKQMEG